jgi:hypothetical protein
MNSEQIQRIKEWYLPGVRISLIEMVREPKMMPGLKGQVTYVDDAAHIHVVWESGSSLSLILGVDQFIAFAGPTAGEYLREKYGSSEKIWLREEIPGCCRAVSIGLDRLIQVVEAYQDKIVGMTSSLAAAMCKPYDTVVIFDAYLADHILSDEKVLQLLEKREFSKTESQKEICPKCGSEDLAYGVAELMDSPYIYYPWKCRSCGAEGKEYGAIEFDGHEVTQMPVNKVWESSPPEVVEKGESQ